MLVFCLFDLFIENILCSCFVCLCCLYKAVYITTCILVEFFDIHRCILSSLSCKRLL